MATQAALAAPEATAPTFDCAPFRGMYQMLAYNVGGFKREYVFRASSDTAAINRANFEAGYEFCPMFILRDGEGREVYHGPVLDALGQPRNAAKPALRVVG